MLTAEPIRIDTRKPPVNDGRTVNLRWLKTTDAEGNKFWAELSIYHYADRKCFVATFGVQQEDGPFMRCSPMDHVRVFHAPVARYSVKARELFIGEALGRLRELHAAGEAHVVGIAAPVAQLFSRRDVAA